MKETKITRGRFLGGLAAAAVVAGAGACGSRERGGSGESGPLLWINDEGDPGTLKVLRSAISDYVDQGGKNVELVEVPPGTDIYTKSLNEIKAGRSYDLASATYQNAPGWAEQGFTEPVDNLIESLGGEDNFLPTTLQKIDGNYPLMPVALTTYMLNYRGDWLEEIGEDVPRTWDQLKVVCKKLTNGERSGIALPIMSGLVTSYVNTNVLWSNQVEFFDEDGTVILDEGEMKERCAQCLEFLKELQPYMAEGMVNADFDDMINLFINEVVGISSYAGRLISNVVDLAPEFAHDVVMEGFPTPAGKKLAVSPYAEGLCVFKPGNAADTEKFLGWFMENGVIDFYHTVPLHLLPTQESIYESEEYKSNSVLKEYASIVEKQRAALTSEDYIRNTVESSTPGPSRLKTEIVTANVIPDMYQKVLLNDVKPVQAIEEAAAHIRELGQGQ